MGELMDGSVGGSMIGVRSNHQKVNKSQTRDNSILFEDL